MHVAARPELTEPQTTAAPQAAETAAPATDPDAETHAPVDRVVDRTPRDRRSLIDIAFWALIVAAKAATMGFAFDALRRADTPKLRGKGIRRRFFGYVGGMFVVPLAWRLSRHPGEYPRGLDLAVTAPLLIDAAGNALGMYQEAHVDDVVHFANSAVVAGVAGAVLAPRFREPWQAAVAGGAISMIAETTWEIVEWSAWKMGADGLQLTYEDTMADIVESWLGAWVGAGITLLRHRTASERRRGDPARAGA
ncbi:MAG: hypothetical protein ACJ77B_00955 [Chloroflexota bacterium]